MDTPLGDPPLAERLIAHARWLYDDLTSELQISIQRLKKNPDDPADPEAKRRLDTIKAHRKALQTILDIELNFAKGEASGKGGGEIHLEEARCEIRRRLDSFSDEKRD